MPPLLHVTYCCQSQRRLRVQTVAPPPERHSLPTRGPIRPHRASSPVKLRLQSSKPRTLSSPAGTVRSGSPPRFRTRRSLHLARSHSPAADLGRTCLAPTEHPHT